MIDQKPTHGFEAMVPGDLYIVVIGKDTDDPRHEPRGPLSWETYFDQPTSLEEVRSRAAQLSKRYGGARIAKIIFID